MFHASNMQREEMRWAVSGEMAFDCCYRSMYQRDLPKTDSSSMGSQDLANFILWLIEKTLLPDDLVPLSKKGPRRSWQPATRPFRRTRTKRRCGSAG